MMTSGFLGPITEIFVFALILASWIHRIISMSCPFLEASWSKAPLNFDSDLVLDPSLLDTNRGNICFSTIKSETLYSLLRIVCTKHQIQFTSILGRSAQSVSKFVLVMPLLIPEPLQAFTLLVPGQSCHFLDQRQRNTASGRLHPGPRSL